MTQRQAKPVMENAQITVLTHGYGANAGTWSNIIVKANEEDEYYTVFAYDKDSLISKIDEETGGANIYLAQFIGYNNFTLKQLTEQNGFYVESEIDN